MNVIFTDIDGVLFNVTSSKWNKKAICWYNQLCHEFNLKAVISSNWRTNHSLSELQMIFKENSIEVEIIDFTPQIHLDKRGTEIQMWLGENKVDKFIILDDSTIDIENQGLSNVVKCRSWIGLSQEEYYICRELLSN